MSRDARAAIGGAVEQLQDVIEWLEALDGNCADDDTLLVGKKLDPASSAEARFNSMYSGSGLEKHEILTRLKIVLDSAELLELASWAQARALLNLEEDAVSYLELNGAMKFDLDWDDGPTAALLQSLLGTHCQACEIESEIGSEENPHPVPKRFHSCRRDSEGYLLPPEKK